PRESCYPAPQLCWRRLHLVPEAGMIVRAFASVLCLVLLPVAATAAQEPVPAAPSGVVPPDQNLPPHIRKLTAFGERADFSLDGRRVLFLSKTFGDAMEIDLETGLIRNL